MLHLIILGITSGIIAGLFTHLAFVAEVLPVIVWVAFLGEATFFAAGGKNKGFVKGLASNLAGVFWAYVIFMVLATWESQMTMSITVFFVVLFMIAQSKIDILSFTPGTFIGAAALFGTKSAALPDGEPIGVIIALILGFVMGWAAEKAADTIIPLIEKKKTAKIIQEENI